MGNCEGILFNFVWKWMNIYGYIWELFMRVISWYFVFSGLKDVYLEVYCFM